MPNDYLPYIRQGISTQLTRRDGDGTVGARASFTVGISIGPGPLSNATGPTQISLAVYGPGDVKTLDARAVTRTWPKPDTTQAEPNYFPLLEVDPPDLPWRYTPARANAQERLRPWIVLVVLRDEEVFSLTPPSSTLPNATLTVNSVNSLPALDQSWAWAHAQVSGAANIDAAGLATILANEPHRVVARLLCARRLDANTAYTGYLVPSLERARRAGLGLPLDDSIDGLAPAWTAGRKDPVVLPVFYSWRFSTGADGDFASLARRIASRVLPPTVGSRPMAVDTPGLGLPAAAPSPLAVQSALRAVESQGTVWPAALRVGWTNNLAAIVNLASQRLKASGIRRLVVPPLYGQWYRALDVLNATNSNSLWQQTLLRWRQIFKRGAKPRPWFEDLNSDPRLRVGAALGTQVVQSAQLTFLASAWRQVTGIREANTLLRQAQLAREAADQVYVRDLAGLPAEQFVAVTSPVHSRVLGSPSTIRSILSRSVLGVGIIDPSWRRLTRPFGALGKRVAKLSTSSNVTILDRLNAGRLPGLPPPDSPASLSTFARAAAGQAPAWLPAQAATGLRFAATGIALLVAILLVILGFFLFALLPLGVAALAVVVFARSALGQKVMNLAALRNGTLSAADIERVSIPSGYVPRSLSPTGGTLALPPTLTDSQAHSAALAFQDSAARVMAELTSPRRAGPTLSPVDASVIRAKLQQSMAPRISVPAAFAKRVKLADGVSWDYARKDSIEPVMPAPTFPDAMSTPLAALSSEWLLAGLDQVPPDTASLASTNRPFVEAYMVGLNHEMARTLLLNQYPTDQRGSYFLQFWKPASLASPGDLTPIAGWQATDELGVHSPRAPTQGSDYLVLLLRAELLRRYPNAIIYATQAIWKNGARVAAAPAVESQPIFVGTLGTGVGYWGFDLTAAQVRGAMNERSGDAGWFFVAQEHPDEARFGLEPTAVAARPANWDDLSWVNLVAASGDLAGVNYIDLTAVLPDASAIQDVTNAHWHTREGARASDLAYITFREPKRLLIHGSQMIPAA